MQRLLCLLTKNSEEFPRRADNRTSIDLYRNVITCHLLNVRTVTPVTSCISRNVFVNMIKKNTAAFVESLKNNNRVRKTASDLRHSQNG